MDDLLRDGHGAYVSRRRVTLAGVHFSPAAIAGVRVLEVKGGQSFIAAMWLAIVVAFPVGFIAHVLNSFQWLAIAVLSGCAAAIGIMIAPRVFSPTYVIVVNVNGAETQALAGLDLGAARMIEGAIVDLMGGYQGTAR